ncbi:ABC transporter permease [uncultured Draconibacterium sp.]|uniref:ABC transporter permease n=1 Tax=uncultured Draconibacterium sp. TaxID=1573823 RepID=UPI0029C964A0|nr:FtsX-like permease family protein [uncultured Draconibacterium sp.]
MLKHYIKYAIRNFRSNRLIFAGSILTVFLCALCISLLFTYVHNELTMDDFHKREKDIYMVTFKDAPESKPEASEASRSFDIDYANWPEVEANVTLKKYQKGEIKFTYGESSFSPAGMVADSTFFEVFDFELARGEKENVMHDPEALIFSKEFARKVFGDEDPIGKNIMVTTRYQKLYTVKGILAEIPSNSSIEFDFLIPDHSMQFNRMGGDFIVAGNSFSQADFVEKLNQARQESEYYKDGISDVVAFDEMYFNHNGIDTIGIVSKHGDKKSIQVLWTIMGVIFLISLLNFSNLQIININSSVKNIGINKITGAGSRHIFYQKLSEIVLLIFIAAVFITMAFKVVVPYFNQIAGVELNPSVWQIFVLNVAVLSVLILVSMVYPSLVYLKIPITNSLKNQVFGTSKLAGRNVVATVQFALSFVLLIASIIVFNQLDLMLNKDLGFTAENTICTQMFHEPHFDQSLTREEMMEKYKAYQNSFQFVKNELESNSSVKAFSLGHAPIDPFEMSWKLKGGAKDYTTEKSLTVTPEYANLLGLKLVEGRFFDRDRDKSRDEKLIINEAAMKYWGITDISTQRILNQSWSRNEGYEIIGVVKDFNFEHLSVRPQPLMILFFEDMEANFLIQFEEGATQSGLQFVEGLFAKNNPGEAFSYTFLSDQVETLYQKEKRMSQIYIIFTIIAFLISATGLFAISLYDTRKRTKEIGVRKVNGAKVSEILALLNKDFLKWVAIAFVIACPIAYYTMYKWLENFAYKTTLSWWIFALSGVMALGIALLTVSWQSWRAATRNPVEALRYE